MSGLDLPLDVTLFRDFSAATAERKRLTLNELAEMAQTRLGAAKHNLPLVKLATFGELRSPKQSLRHRANMVEISGIEADYDAGLMPIEAAADRLRAAGVAALLYTSPSHMPGAPRWRVLCPLSRPAPVASRRDLLGRINAILGGVLATESFTDAQSFYIGGTDTASVEILRVPGDPLDRANLPAPLFPSRQEATAIPLPPMRQDQSGSEHLARAIQAVHDAFARRGDVGRHQIVLGATALLAPFVMSGHINRDDAAGHVADAMEADGRTPSADEIEEALDGRDADRTALFRADQRCGVHGLAAPPACARARPPAVHVAGFPHRRPSKLRRETATCARERRGAAWSPGGRQEHPGAGPRLCRGTRSAVFRPAN